MGQARISGRALTLATLSLVAVWLTAASAQEPRHLEAEGGNHAPMGVPIKYSHYPPTSGNFWGEPAPWGTYEEEVPEEIWLHNLAHGGIAILYRCDTPCAELEQQLRDAHHSFPRSKWGHVKLLVTPYPKLKTRLAVVAWTWIDEMDAFDRDRLLRFYTRHLDRGPSDVP